MCSQYSISARIHQRDHLLIIESIVSPPNEHGKFQTADLFHLWKLWLMVHVKNHYWCIVKNRRLICDKLPHACIDVYCRFFWQLFRQPPGKQLGESTQSGLKDFLFISHDRRKPGNTFCYCLLKEENSTCNEQQYQSSVDYSLVFIICAAKAASMQHSISRKCRCSNCTIHF